MTNTDSTDRQRQQLDLGMFATGEDQGGDSGGPNRPGDQRGPNGQPSRPNRGVFGGVVIVVIIAMVIAVMASLSSQSSKAASWSEFQVWLEQGQLSDIVIKDTGIFAVRTESETAPPERVVYDVSVPEMLEHYVKQVDEATNGDFREEKPSIWRPIIGNLLVIGLILFMIWFLVLRGLRNAAAGAGGGMLGSFGKSRHKVLAKEMTGVTFDDVAGIDEAEGEVSEIIEFLKDPKRFTKIGGRIPRGVLLTGPPGCGKTLLAKAIAGEADVPFFSISGSDFVEMFVGVGASRVRDLFKQAKESSPCIIFLDEIDAVGRRRGGGFNSGGHDEREQTLNAILVEMDGFNSGDGVIVIAATNRPDVLDPALTRPGRFDRQIPVTLPDVKGRLEILRVHAKKVKLGPDVDLEKLARVTPMFSGADLAAIVNEAAIGATLLNKDFIEQEDLEEARDKVRFGRAKKGRHREDEENRLTAYHEAGHAVMQVLMTHADPLHKVTIIPRGDTGGATFSLPEKDRMGYSARWLHATMRVVCAGRIAEEKAMGDISSGASMDISQLTRLARMMVLEWGMSEKLGFVRYAGTDQREYYVPDRDFSEETAGVIDSEIRRMSDEAYQDAIRILDEHWAKVVAVAESLLKHETLNAQEVGLLMEGKTLNKPTVRDLLDAEAALEADSAGPAGPGEEDAGPDVPPDALPSPA